MTEQDSVRRANGPAPEYGADPSPEIHCHATTRAGQPCRNRPLEGQNYCRVHAPLDGAESAAPSQVVTLTGGTDDQELPIGGTEAVPIGNAALEDAGQAETAAAVQELEVEIRNHDEGAATRDLAAEALRLIRENLRRMTPEAVQRAARLVRDNLSSDYLDPDFWRGVGMVLQYQVDEIRGLIQRRMRGEYTVDVDGMDAELIDLVRPFSAFLYRTWWRVTAAGLENVPDTGRALLIANHSGVLPWDAVMIAAAVLEEQAQPRVVRALFPSATALLPGLKQTLNMFGQVEDTAGNATRLLEADELVCVFPEGVQGLGKLFKDRYKLGRFRRSGSVGIAIATGAPIVPVAVVGAEETYPMLADLQPLAQALRLPFFPLTPLFPWLGPLGLIPLPTKWSIAFGEPIATAEYGPGAAADPLVLSRLAEQVRGQIQGMLDQLLAARKTVF